MVQKTHNQGMSTMYSQCDSQKMTVTGRKRITLGEFHASTSRTHCTRTLENISESILTSIYYLSADEPFWGPPLFFCAPHFNFMELKWGWPKEKWGQQKFSGASRRK